MENEKSIIKTIKLSMYVTCPHCGKDFDVCPEEDKCFDCPHCNGYSKRLLRSWHDKICISCHWSRDSDKCYVLTGKIDDFDKAGYDYNKENFRAIEQSINTCGLFESWHAGDFNSEGEYVFKKRNKVEGYYTFWRGLNSYLYPKNEINSLEYDCVIKLVELNTGNVYTTTKMNFKKHCRDHHEDDYYLDMKHWNLIKYNSVYDPNKEGDPNS